MDVHAGNTEDYTSNPIPTSLFLEKNVYVSFVVRLLFVWITKGKKERDLGMGLLV